MLGFCGSSVAYAASPAVVNLGTAGNFSILSKTGVSTTGTTTVVGDIGLSPAAASYLTGFALTLPTGGVFSTSPIVTGKVFAPGYADPTPANLTTAVLDMQTAYTDAAGRAPTVTELGAGNIDGQTLVPGVYKWGTGVTISNSVTLSGSAQDVWIFQIAQTLTVSSTAKVILSGGAEARNVFWVVAGQTTLGTASAFNGTILDQTAIVLNTGAVLNGRALAHTAVTLDANKVTAPLVNPVVVVVPPAPSPTPVPVVAPVTPVAPTIGATTPIIPEALTTNNPIAQGAAIQVSLATQQIKTVIRNLGSISTTKLEPIFSKTLDTILSSCKQYDTLKPRADAR